MVSKDIISNSVEKYSLFGIVGLIENGYKGHNYKMTGDQEKAVVVEFVENAITSTKVVIKWVKEHFGIAYPEQGMYYFLKRYGFVYKRPKGVPEKDPNEEGQKAVAEDF